MDKKQLLLDLYNAESGEAVYKTVLSYGLDGEEYWRPYGGNQNNAGTFENQQSVSENALVEKLTNSIDAILMKNCYARCIDPKDKTNPELPCDMDAAVEKFFGVKNGKWENVVAAKRNPFAQNIQVLVTGDIRKPNIAIYDNGEGQNPDQFPNTFLSIGRGNKNDVPFVQGKYNFGSTGALAFCGDGDKKLYRYQMIISRRNSDLTDGDGNIGFTLVRRHILSKAEEQNVKLTWYEYLVIDGEIPSIKAEPLNLGLYKKHPFRSGSIVKMYSYKLTKPSNATSDLWRELNQLLFVSALPILICEQRKEFNLTSNTKTMLGNQARLALDGKSKVEFSKAFSIHLFDCCIPVKVYIFNRETKNPDFIRGKSVIYTLNGQTQGTEGKSFISQDLGFRNLREYMLVSVDCSQLAASVRQDLFMASRDRLKQGDYYEELSGAIIDLLKHDADLIRMEQEYKGKAFRETGEDRSLIESFFSRLRSNSDIKKILSGKHGAFSFFTKKTQKPADRSEQKKEEKKKLQRYPSVFRVKGFEKSDENYVKAVKHGSKGRVTLETDVENDFLSRSEDNGSLEITEMPALDNGQYGETEGAPHSPGEDHKKLNVEKSGPYDGEIQIFIEPTEYAEVGDNIPLSIKMISRMGEHEVVVFVKIEKESELTKEPKKKTVEEPELSLPKLVRVVKESSKSNEATWESTGMDADKVVKLSIGSEGSVEKILINMDSKLVKRLVNMKNTNIETASSKYLTSVYSHALMVYTTLYGYFSRDDIEMDETIVKEIQDKLNEAVEFSFKFYTSFLMAYEDISDKAGLI